MHLGLIMLKAARWFVHPIIAKDMCLPAWEKGVGNEQSNRLEISNFLSNLEDVYLATSNDEVFD